MNTHSVPVGPLGDDVGSWDGVTPQDVSLAQATRFEYEFDMKSQLVPGAPAATSMFSPSWLRPLHRSAGKRKALGKLPGQHKFGCSTCPRKLKQRHTIL